MASALQLSIRYPLSEDDFTGQFSDDFAELDFENIPGMQSITNANDRTDEHVENGRPRSSRASSEDEGFPEAMSSFIQELDAFESRLTRLDGRGSPCKSPTSQLNGPDNR
jgi:hypothetical protein